MRATALLALAITLATATPARAEILKDPALVCAAARAGNGAWLDTTGLRRCLASERMREIDAREIQSLRHALRRESDARRTAETESLRAMHWRWYYFGGGVSLGVVVTVLIVGAS